MKILHIISGGDRGGAKTHMFAMLERMREYADVTVVCLMQGEFYLQILEKPIRTLLFEQKNRTDLSVCEKIKKLIADEHIDIVNAHGARANFIMTFIQRSIGIPTVTTVHSDPRLDFDNPYKKIVFGGLNELALHKIKYKIAVSDSFRDMLIERGSEPNDVGVVYNGIKFGAAAPSCTKQQFADKHKIPYVPGDVYIGMAARLDKVKGVDVFLRAAAEIIGRVPNARFVIIGSGFERDGLYALMRSLHIENRTHFLGFVSEIYDFYNFIDVNCMSSHSESFPYALLEGANACKATVASAVGGIPKLIIDGDTGVLFPAGDCHALADRLVRLVEDRNNGGRLIEKYGARLGEYAREHFSSDALAKAYLANYESFIKYYNDEKTNDIVLTGYYGFGNLGDELLASTLTARIKQASPDARLTVMTASPKEGREKLGVNCINRLDPFAIRRTLRRSRLLVLGGGSLIQDVTSRKSLTYYLTLVNWAKDAGIKAALIAGGVGPLKRRSSVRAAVKTLAKLDCATLRDSESCAFFDEHCPNVPHKTTADAAFLTQSAKCSQKGGYLLIAIRPWKTAPQDFPASVGAAAARYALARGLEIVAVPLQPKTDADVTRRAADIAIMNGAKARVADLDGRPLDEALKLITGASVVLGMRLHSLICAACASVPVAGISYDEKIDSFFAECSLPAPLKIEDADADSIADALENSTALPPAAAEKFRLASQENIGAVIELLRR